MISRVVPRPEPDPLVIVAEDYNEWTVRAEAFRGDEAGGAAALELVDNQTARLERKLFIHNGGHAVCGYFGFHRGHEYIHEAVADPVVAEHVLGALDELGEVVRRKWGFSAESIDDYKQDLCRRGAVPEMRDEILRVVRDPIRKLSPRERLVAPANLAVEYGLPRQWIVKAIVAALRYPHPQDPQSVVLAEQLAQQGLSQVSGERLRHRPRLSVGGLKSNPQWQRSGRDRFHGFALTWLDWIVGVVAVVGSILFGWYMSRRVGAGKDSSSFFLAGRNLPWWIVGLSLYATNIGAEHLVGLTGDAYRYGLSAGTVELTTAMCLGFAAAVLFPYYIRNQVFTIPEFLEMRYNPLARSFFSGLMLVICIMTKMAFCLYAGALVLQSLLGWDVMTTVAVLAVVTAIFTMVGGFAGVAYADIIQSTIKILGCG